MKALVGKELRTLAVPAAFAGLATLALWVLRDPYAMFFAPSMGALGLALVLAALLGAWIGDRQGAGERERGTLSFLLHRDVPAGRILLAQCVAAWIALAAALGGALVLAWVHHRATSPLAPVLQPRRLAELLFASAFAIPAHALGLCAAGVRGGLLGRIGALAAALLGVAAGCLAAASIPVEPARRALVVALAGLVPALAALAVARARLPLADDPERAPRAFEIALALALFALPIGAIAALGLGWIQFALVEAVNAPRESIVWHPEHGFAFAGAPVEEEGSATWILRDASGAVVAEVGPVSGWPSTIFMPGEGWVEVWSPDGRLADGLAVGRAPDQPTRRVCFPSFAPSWTGVRRRSGFGKEPYFPFVAVLPDGMEPDADPEDEDPLAPRVLKIHLDAAAGLFRVLSARPAPPGAGSRWSDFDLRALARGDGRPFGSQAFCFRADEDEPRSAWPSDYGDLADPSRRRITVFDPTDDTAWTLHAVWPLQGFVPSDARPGPYRFDEDALLVGRYERSDRGIPVEPGADALASRMRVRAIAEGDGVASSVRVVDAQSGDVLIERRYELETAGARAAAAALYATELLRPPAVALVKHAEPEREFSWGIRLDGFLVTAGSRRALLVANLAAALALALAARRRLVRRGAERWRRMTWTLAVAILGPIAALAFVAIEPQAARATRRVEARGDRRIPVALLERVSAT